MKKLIYAFIVCFWSASAFAQTDPSTGNSPTPEKRAERITNWMNKKLTLTADQKTKIYDVNLKYAKLNQQTRANDADDKKTMRQELKASETEREGEFKAILTPDQFTTFQAAKRELWKAGRDRRKRN